MAMTQSTLQGNDTKNVDDRGKSIGEELRAARLRAGMSIADVTQTIRISRDFVKMLEAGEFDTLPSPTYCAGYIRSYGVAVGIESAAVAKLVEAYYAQLADGAATPSYKFPLGDQRPRRSGALAASIAVLVAVSSYTGWYLMDRPQTIEDFLIDATQTTGVISQIESTMTESGALSGGADARLDQIVSSDDVTDLDALSVGETALNDVQSRNATNATLIKSAQQHIVVGENIKIADAYKDRMAELPVAPASVGPEVGNVMAETDLAQNDDAGIDPSSDTLTTDQQPALTLGEDVQIASASMDVAGEMPLVARKSAGDLTPDQGSAIANQRDPANEVTLRARASSWVEIVRNDGEEVMTRLMREGDTYLIDASDSLYLSTGNAGGLEFVFNDGTVKEVGEIGEIVRDLPLVISGLKTKL